MTMTIESPEGLHLYKFQIEGVIHIEKCNGRALIADEMGLGKAQPISSKILTPTGYKTLKDCKVGDKIFGNVKTIPRKTSERSALVAALQKDEQTTIDLRKIGAMFLRHKYKRGSKTTESYHGPIADAAQSSKIEAN